MVLTPIDNMNSVFLASRTKTDIKRNALVSGMLMQRSTSPDNYHLLSESLPQNH